MQTTNKIALKKKAQNNTEYVTRVMFLFIFYHLSAIEKFAIFTTKKLLKTGKKMPRL